MSTSESTPEQAAQLRTSFESFLHNTSLLTLVAAPALILLPPRKIDFYTFSLAGAFSLAGSHLWSERQERLGRNSDNNNPGGWDWALPPKAAELQRPRRLLEESVGSSHPHPHPQQSGGGSLLEEKAKEIWMGGETAGWKERRLEEERKKLAEGEGYGSMIMDQIREVWNWGEDKSQKHKQQEENKGTSG